MIDVFKVFYPTHYNFAALSILLVLLLIFLLSKKNYKWSIIVGVILIAFNLFITVPKARYGPSSSSPKIPAMPTTSPSRRNIPSPQKRTGKLPTNRARSITGAGSKPTGTSLQALT